MGPKSIPFSEGQCVLHKRHLPVPAELHYHHVIPLWMQKALNVKVDDGANEVLVCPTGHINIHNVIGRLLKGEVPLGRRGKTGHLALQAFEWYKDNATGTPEAARDWRLVRLP